MAFPALKRAKRRQRADIAKPAPGRKIRCCQLQCGGKQPQHKPRRQQMPQHPRAAPRAESGR